MTMIPSANKQGKPGSFWALMMLLNLLLFLFFAWMLYDRLSMHFGVSSVEIIPQAQPEAITRRVMPESTPLPSELEVPKSTETKQAVEAKETTEATKAEKAKEPIKTIQAKPEKTQATEPVTTKKPAEAAETKSKKTPKPSTPKEKMQRVDFEYSNPEAKSVLINGSFLSWKPRPMNHEGNSWRVSLHMPPGKYRYHFVVDGKKTLDPSQPLKRKEESSLVVIPKE